MRLDRNQLRLNRLLLRLDRFQQRLDCSQLPLDFTVARVNLVAAQSLFSDHSAYLTILLMTDNLKSNNFVLFYVLTQLRICVKTPFLSYEQHLTDLSASTHQNRFPPF